MLDHMLFNKLKYARQFRVKTNVDWNVYQGFTMTYGDREKGGSAAYLTFHEGDILQVLAEYNDYYLVYKTGAVSWLKKTEVEILK